MRRTQGLKQDSRGTVARTTSVASRHALAGLGLALLLPLGAWAAQKNAALPPQAPASVPTIAPATPVVENSYLDGALLYQLLLSEFALREGQPADAVELMLEAARRNKDDALYRRALQIAVEAGAGDKALSITHSWRQAMPKSTEALRTEIQLLIAFDRLPETTEPLKQLLAMSTPAERTALIASLPRAQQRAKDKAAAAEQFRQLLQPYMDAPDAGVAAHVALGRIRLTQGQPMFALDLAEQAQALDPRALPPVLLALDVMNTASEGSQAGASAAAASAAASAPPAKGTAPSTEVIAKAEILVQRYLAQPGSEPVVRQAYASVLATQQRLTDAAAQLRLAVKDSPKQAQLWLALGEIDLELHDPVTADADLKQALQLVTAQAAEQAAARKAAAAAAAASGAATVSDDDDDTPDTPPAADTDATANPVRVSHVQLLLARAAEQRHDDAAAAKWLAQVDAKDADLQVIALRAGLLARQGKLGEALKMVRAASATTPAEQRYKLLTEVQLLMDEKKLGEAREVLNKANAESPDDVELVYQEAMVDERLNRLDDMEKLLRRILVLQPDNSQALNALGYSLADRNLRLDEALKMVRQAHELSPADPFIVDSLGWVEYRMGHFDAATALLAQAYSSRKDTEIAAHLGEALWADGKHDEAARVLRDAHKLDAGNEVLKKTMNRLKVAP